jgi:hypothetical protein
VYITSTRSREHQKEAHEGQAEMIVSEGKFQITPVKTWERPFEATPVKNIRANVVPRIETPKAKKEFKGPISGGQQITLQQFPEERVRTNHTHTSTNFVRKIEIKKGFTHSNEDLLLMTEKIEMIL